MVPVGETSRERAPESVSCVYSSRLASLLRVRRGRLTTSSMVGMRWRVVGGGAVASTCVVDEEVEGRRAKSRVCGMSEDMLGLGPVACGVRLWCISLVCEKSVVKSKA